MPIAVPAGVTVEIKENNDVIVKGPKGTLERVLPAEMEIKQEDGHVVVSRPNDLKKMKSLHGLTRTLISNMVQGVDQGFSRKLAVEGVGYRASVNASTLTLNVGYSSPVDFTLPAGITATVDKDNSITIEGIDKELVGLTAAKVRAIRKPEPYKGKGIRYADEHIVRKVGKAGGKK